MKSLQTGGKVKADRDRGIMFGDTEIDLSYVEQLVDTSQTRFETQHFDTTIGLELCKLGVVNPKSSNEIPLFNRSLIVIFNLS